MVETLQLATAADIRNKSFSGHFRGYGSPTRHHFEYKGANNSLHYPSGLPKEVYVTELSRLKQWLASMEEQPFPHPVRCDTCPPNRQKFLWRTFTNTSWQTFVKKNYQSSSFNPSDAITHDYKGRPSFSDRYVNRPGTLWTATDPRFALSIGIARKLIEKETVKLLGINVCQHDLKNGMELWDIYQYPDKYHTAYSLSIKDLARYGFSFSEGIIVNHIPPEKLTQGVLFDVKTGAFKQLTDMRTAIPGLDRSTALYLYTLSSLIHQILIEITPKDLGYKENDYSLNTVSPMIHGFLSPTVLKA